MTFSGFFGHLSQLFWLFAQIPQIWTNYQLKSVDGLALPFLISWFCGDLTNLIGCILTNQLAFQRNLAIYFNLVDVVLLFQYALYYQLSPSATGSYRPLSSDPNPLLPHDAAEGLSFESQWAVDQASPVDLERTAAGRSLNQDNSAIKALESVSIPVDSALDQPLHPSLTDCTRSTTYGTVLMQQSKPLAVPCGSNTARLDRQLLPHLTTIPCPKVPTRSISSSSACNILPPLVLVGFFTFVVFISPYGLLALYQIREIKIEAQTGLEALRVKCPGAIGSNLLLPHLCIISQRLEEGRGWQELVGKASAWICACLYFTSRFPQIYKNYQRKSVEGLSISLFVMAFLGNLTYVISILSSSAEYGKAADETQNSLESSIPYLIGSGGTLCFDLIIYAQSRMYGHSQNAESTSPFLLKLSRVSNDHFKLGRDNFYRRGGSRAREQSRSGLISNQSGS